MKKTKMIGVLCMMLVMWLGCTKDASAAANVDTACIFDEKIIELPSALGAVSDMQIAKGRICLRSEDGKMLYAGTLDGSKVKKVFSDKDSVKDYFRVFTLDQKGNLYLLKHKSDEKKGIIEEYVEKRDKTGKLVATIKLGRKYEEKRSIDFDAYGILVDKNNKIYVFSRHGIHVYDSRGSEYKGEGVEVFLNPFNRAFFSKDGKIIILFQSFEELIGTTYRVYNPQKGTVSKSRKMAVGEMAGQSMSYDRGFDFYTNTKTSLYGYSHKSGEKTELINWIDSGIDEWIYPGLIARVSDETLIAITYQYNEKEGKDCSKLCIFSRRDAGEIKKKKVITMVANSNQFELVKNIMDFNRT
ncbi:MAG: hypothetical protein PWP24_1216, partial [Clostridiales bacterium]|nr:hypothetical protein [Clostridiales bacterium]